MRGEARPMERARLLIGEALADDEGRGLPPAQEPRGERERKAHRRRPVLRLCRDDLMQGVAGEAAAQRGIEGAHKGQAPRGPVARGAARRAGFRLDLGDDAPETRHPLRSAAWRHSVRALLFVICSCFGPKGRGSQGTRRSMRRRGRISVNRDATAQRDSESLSQRFTAEDAPAATTNPEERFEWCPIRHQG